jgi:dTDP-4-dehydrorhamnose 3,5-epimerase
MKNGFFIHTLEKHQTKDTFDSHVNGELTVIWRDWDKVINDPKMIYLNIINGNEVKGPHLHQNRTSYFFCIEGEIILVVRDDLGKYHEVKTNSEKSELIEVKNGIAAAIVNPSTDLSKVLVLADIAWKPDDNEMKNVEFQDYDWSKWK